MPLFEAPTVIAILSIAFAGGIIGLDRTAAGQFMVSQPIVAAPLTGLLLGDAVTGLVIGVILELIWLVDMPVGTFVPADSTVASIFASAVAILGSPGGPRMSVLGFSILLTAALAPITIKADQMMRQYNARLGIREEASRGMLTGSRLARVHLSGLGVFFLKFFVLFLVSVPAGIIAVRMFLSMPDVYHRAMELYVKLLPLLGTAIVARKLSMKTLDLFLLGGFAIAVVAGQIFAVPSLVVILLTTAGGWLGARYREQRA